MLQAGIQQSELPRRLREDRRLGTGHACRRDADELAALPLARAPLRFADVGFHVDRAGDRIPRSAIGDGVDDLLVVERAGLLDRLLQDLQAGIGGGARPAVRCVAGNGDLALIVILRTGQAPIFR